jgi:predicted CopG family antitoxin
MAFRTVMLAEDAYGCLAERRQPGESFRDVVRRSAGRRSLRELEGPMSKEGADALARAIAQGERERKRRRRAELEGRA